MSHYDNVGLYFENYKSFGPGLAGFDQIAPINVIVGRNNSGKSALIDLLEQATALKGVPSHLFHAKAPARIVLSRFVSERVAKAVFPENASGGPLPGSHWGAGKRLVGAQIKIELHPNAQSTLVELSPNINHLASGNL